MLGVVKQIYNALPVGATRFLSLVPDKVLFGESYRRTIPGFEAQSIPAAMVESLNYAREHTKFWSSKIPVRLSQADAMDIYDQLPSISSRDLADDMSLFISNEYDKRNSYGATTGGTGRAPTPVLLSNDSFGVEWRHIHFLWSCIGYQRLKHLKLTITGRKLAADNFVRFNPVYNELVADFFSVTLKNFPEFFSKLNKYRIDYLETYPSLLRELRGYLDHFGFSMTLKGIMLGSEEVDQKERREAEVFFRCPIVAWYGQSERVILAVDLEGSGKYKVLTSYGYPDILDDGNGFGEIVGTTFINKALPLIKYRTGDYGSLEEDSGEIYLNNIRGRWGKDFLYSKSGKRIPSTAVNLHSEIQNEISFYQLVQSQYGEVKVVVLPKRSSRLTRDIVSSKILDELSRKLVGFKLECIVVEDERCIKRSGRGKMMMLVQYLTEQ